MLAAADRMEASRDDWTIRHRLVQRHHSLAVRRSAWFSEVERGLAEEIARRTGLDPDLDTYPLLVVTTAIPAIRVATAVWQERPRRGTLSDLVDETFDALGHGLTLLQPVGAHRPVAPPGPLGRRRSRCAEKSRLSSSCRARSPQLAASPRRQVDRGT
jgi:hypothetical protein